MCSLLNVDGEWLCVQSKQGLRDTRKFLWGISHARNHCKMGITNETITLSSGVNDLESEVAISQPIPTVDTFLQVALPKIT